MVVGFVDGVNWDGCAGGGVPRASRYGVFSSMRDASRQTFRMRVLLLVVCGLYAPCVAQDRCLVYHTTFESFDAPVDDAGASWSIGWCQGSGAVAASGFCPSGGAYRLAGAGDALAATVELHPTCADVLLSFTMSSLYETNSRLELREACSGAVIASAFVPATGGACMAYEFLFVPPEDPFVLAWVHGGGAASIVLLDDVRVALGGCCEVLHDCCIEGGPSCEDASISECVCAVDPYCCLTAWDALCVEHVSTEQCGSCGSACGEALHADFGTAYQPGGPCVNFPEVIAACLGNGPWLTIGGPCASVSDVAVRFGEGVPWSAFETVCVSLAHATSARLSFTYATPMGILGPVVEVLIDGVAFEVFSAGVSTDGACTHVRVNLAAFLGESDVSLRISSGSVLGANTLFDDLRLITGGDLNGDGAVNGADLGVLLAAWGSADPLADLDGDGMVDAADLGHLLVLYGS